MQKINHEVLCSPGAYARLQSVAKLINLLVGVYLYEIFLSLSTARKLYLSNGPHRNDSISQQRAR